jgi:hypothetical protein
MLIESYVVEFAELKRCITGLRMQDFMVVSENIFLLNQAQSGHVDLLTEHTPSNHPEALLLVNKEYARSLILNEDSFEFLKKSHDIHNLKGVTLHLAFVNSDLMTELADVCVKKSMDGVPVQVVDHEALLVAQQAQEKRYKENAAILKKSISIYRG